MGDVYDVNVRLLHKELLQRKQRVEETLSALKNQNSKYAGDLKRMTVLYDLLLSHFGEYDDQS